MEEIMEIGNTTVLIVLVAILVSVILGFVAGWCCCRDHYRLKAISKKMMEERQFDQGKENK